MSAYPPLATFGQPTPIQGNALEARHHLLALCAMWEQVCLEKGWSTGHQLAYPNAVNKLADTLAWSSHLRQQVQLMCRMWERVCLHQGWQPDALPTYIEARAFLAYTAPYPIR